MNKLILKLFDFLKSIVHFIKILSMLFLMLHLIYWIQNLTNAQFGWLQFFTPVLKNFVSIGELFTKGSVDLLGAVFEYKYGTAVVIYLVIYFVCNCLMLFLDTLKDKFDDVDRFVRKTNENLYNASLKSKQEKNELKIQNYKIFITTALKPKFSHPELNCSIDEENKKMNKFLSNKIGVESVEYEGGFLYSLDTFYYVDNSLDALFKIINSNSPLDYIVCIQVVDKDDNTCIYNLKQLADLKRNNKITIFSNTAYRYKFNSVHKYGTSHVGVFNLNTETIEVHEFIEI